MSETRALELKREWAAHVGADDPDSLDDWPVETIMDLEAKIASLDGDDEIERLRLAIDDAQDLLESFRIHHYSMKKRECVERAQKILRKATSPEDE